MTEAEKKDIETAIKALRDENERIRQKLRENDASIRALVMQHAGIKVGDLVTYHGKVFAVEGSYDIEVPGHRKKPWLTGRRIKKDGDKSMNSQTLYGDWELVEKAAS